MSIFKSLGRKKGRKYPIKRDQEGSSLRTRCFEQFDQGKRPAAVAAELQANMSTTCRYFRDWQRLGPNFALQYAFAKELFKKTAPDRDKNIELFARMLGISQEQMEAVLSHPHGLRRFLTGKLYFPIQADADHKRHIALQLGVLFSEYLIGNKGKFSDVFSALHRYLMENGRFRGDEEADIKARNEEMAIIHQVLAADLENERKGRVKQDRLSEDEITTLLKSEQKMLLRKQEAEYWAMIAALMFKGLTKEQAREKLYQDLLVRGDEKAAKSFRAYQDIVHPLQGDVPKPPNSSETTPEHK
jgi:hypothetical protein